MHKDQPLQLNAFLAEFSEVFSLRKPALPDDTLHDLIEWNSYNQMLLVSLMSELSGRNIVVNDFRPFESMEYLYQSCLHKPSAQID